MDKKALTENQKFNLAFHGRLLQLIKERNIKQAILAKAIGISPSTLSKYINHPAKGPSAYWAARVAQYFNVSLQWMGGLTEERDLIEAPDIPHEYHCLSSEIKEFVNDSIIRLYHLEKRQASTFQAAETIKFYE